MIIMIKFENCFYCAISMGKSICFDWKSHHIHNDSVGVTVCISHRIARKFIQIFAIRRNPTAQRQKFHVPQKKTWLNCSTSEISAFYSSYNDVKNMRWKIDVYKRSGIAIKRRTFPNEKKWVGLWIASIFYFPQKRTLNTHKNYFDKKLFQIDRNRSYRSNLIFRVNQLSALKKSALKLVIGKSVSP